MEKKVEKQMIIGYADDAQIVEIEIKELMNGFEKYLKNVSMTDTEKQIFKQDNYVGVSKDKNKVGSIYFGGKDVIEKNEEEYTSYLETAEKICMGGRIRLVHSSGPSIEVQKGIKRVNVRLTNQSKVELRERIDEVNGSIPMGQDSYFTHESRGELVKDMNIVKHIDIDNLFKAVKYAMKLNNEEFSAICSKFEDDEKEIINSNTNLKDLIEIVSSYKGNYFLYEFINSMSNQKNAILVDNEPLKELTVLNASAEEQTIIKKLMEGNIASQLIVMEKNIASQQIIMDNNKKKGNCNCGCILQ